MKHHRTRIPAETLEELAVDNHATDQIDGEDIQEEGTQSNDNGMNRISPSTQYSFFWKAGSPFSQWTPSHYVLNGVQYSSAEQGMMHGKALLFDDVDTAEQIMSTSHPGKIKKLGRQVKGFKEKTWKHHRVRIVYENNMAKFTQNESLKTALLATEGKNLVEASPQDRIWGIGLHERDARNIPEKRWPGLNLLGKVLMQVIEDIIIADCSEDEEKCEQNE